MDHMFTLMSNSFYSYLLWFNGSMAIHGHYTGIFIGQHTQPVSTERSLLNYIQS